MAEINPHALIASLPMAAYACDAQGLLTDFNSAAAKLWGRSPKLHCPDQRFGGAFHCIAPDGTLEQPEESCMARMLATGIPCTGEEVTFEHEDGNQVHAYFSGFLLKGKSGNTIGAIGMLMDITSQIEARRTLEKQVADHQRTEQLIHESNEQEQHLAMHFLHEDIGQRLTGLALLSGVLNKALARESNPLAKKAAELSKLTGGCIAIASDLAKSYYPLNLHSDGLNIALEFLAQRTESHFKVCCRFQRADVFVTPKKHAIHLYRMVQIVILDAIANFGAEMITIGFKVEDAASSIIIKHDVTTRSKKQPKPLRAEMTLLNSRARLTDALIDIREEAGRQVTISWPTA